MNPGLTEEAGSAARSAIDALKSTPFLLSVLIFNVVLLGLVAYLSANTHERWKDLVETTMKYCLPAAGVSGAS